MSSEVVPIVTLEQVSNFIDTLKTQISREKEMIGSLENHLKNLNDTLKDSRIKSDETDRGEIKETQSMLNRHKSKLEEFEKKLEICKKERDRLSIEKLDREGKLDRASGTEMKETK